MSTNLPTLAILGGTGKEGPGLALRWAYAGYPILIGSRQAEKAQATAADLTVRLNQQKSQAIAPPSIRGMENHEAARAADICILTVVHTAHQAALQSLRESLKGKILVDATARVDFRDPRPPKPPAAARYAQNLLGPEVRVVAAFQNVPAHVLRKNLGQTLDTDVLICADDLTAAQEVRKLAEAAGMRAYIAGGLDNAVVVEGITALLIGLNQHYGIRTASIQVTGIESGTVR